MAKTKPLLRGIKRNTDQAAMSQALSDAGPTSAAPQSFPAAAQSREASPAAAPMALPSADADISRLYQVGQKYPVPLNFLARSPNQARHFYTAEDLDETAKSLNENGQEVAAKGYVRDGRVLLIDGVKRFQSSTIAGRPTLDVEIEAAPEDDAKEYEQSRRINLERSQQTALDDAVRWKDMIEKGAYKDQTDLGRRLGIGKENVSKTMGLNRIPERLLRMMSEHPQTRALTIAYEISNIFGAEQFKDAPEKAEYIAQDVIEETTKKDLSRAQVIALIASKLTGPKTRVRSEAHSVKYGDYKGTLKVFAKRGQFQLAFEGLPQDKLEELQTRVEQMLAGQLTI